MIEGMDRRRPAREDLLARIGDEHLVSPLAFFVDLAARLSIPPNVQ